jgi:hypothetical protein
MFTSNEMQAKEKPFGHLPPGQFNQNKKQFPNLSTGKFQKQAIPKST